MNRINTRFEKLKKSQQKALIPYLTAGDPNRALTLALMKTCVAQGAHILELGVPFSDPMADGPVIQAAMERALATNTNLKDVFGIVEAFRREDNETPIILMGYLNPIEQFGYQAFAAQAQRAGVDGVLIVDCLPHEVPALETMLSAHDLAAILLVAPTTSQQRSQVIANNATGFIYYIALKGITGADINNKSDVAAQLKQLRACTDTPICVGFGIKDPHTAKQMSQMADGVVVGSAFVKLIATYQADEKKLLSAVGDLVSKFANALL